MSVCRLALVGLLSTGAVAACDDAPAQSGLHRSFATEAGETTATAPESSRTEPTDALGRRLSAQVSTYASGMEPTGPAFRGSLVEGEKHDYQAVLQSRRCFRIVGVGSDGVGDLDLFLFDPNGVQARQDLAQDNVPVLGLGDPICPERSGAYRVQVRMVEGEGAFAVQILGSAG